MNVMTNEGNSHAVVIDDNQHEHELSEQFLGTSPTPRSAADHADIDLGRSQAFVEMLKQVDVVSSTNSPVLLTGEPGAGKEFVAAAIHHRSGRSDWPFVVINCAAIPAELVESKLFGRDQDRSGLFENIDGGTVLLDELTQTGPTIQLKLLRLLQTGETSRAGSSETLNVNVRVIAASSCNFEDEVAAGRFSSDLFNTLNAVSIAIPPMQDLHEHMSAEVSAPAEPANDDWVTLSEIEGRYVARVLEHTRGNKQAAARVLAVDRKTLDRMIKRHNIDCQHARALRAKASARISS
jgi:transcriptional regulator with GAF, ATPase, and Fis domain